jgi:hypothetical protein
MSLNAHIAIADSFLDAFSNIPKNMQGKVCDFMIKFRTNPDSTGINYEKIQACKDKHLRSVRIDQNYQAIVHKPDNGNTHILLWVDNHDRAYDWARRRTLSIHPETGAIQILPAEQIEAAEGREATGTEITAENYLFAAFRDRELIKLGLPENLLPAIRRIKTEPELDRLSEILPAECTEALIGLACGFSVAEILLERDIAENATVNTEDFATALNNPDSQRRFAVITDDLHLQEILSAPLDKWRVFLHPTQRQLVSKKANGPVRVSGGAGTGKTVVAMHRAKWQAEQLNPGSGEKILFTTFSRNLAHDIEMNLKAICHPEIMERIKIINLDRWVWDNLKKFDYGYRPASDEEKSAAWKEALSEDVELEFANSFYREEWEKVILPGGVETPDEYLRISRAGRGTAVSRNQRRKIWVVLQEYRNQLELQRICENDRAYRDLINLMKAAHAKPFFRSVVVDEAQDMGMSAFRLLRFIVPEAENDLFIVGDAHQRIYGKKVVLGQCGIKITGRSKRLKVNYRTTDEIRRLAVSVLNKMSVDDLDGGEDSVKGYHSLLHGQEPDSSSPVKKNRFCNPGCPESRWPSSAYLYKPPHVWPAPEKQPSEILPPTPHLWLRPLPV